MNSNIALNPKSLIDNAETFVNDNQPIYVIEDCNVDFSGPIKKRKSSRLK